ncbi:MAG: TlpA disulfide reductase family protein, partial [Planctomycetota bacterium]|nr:TlpA disulfide reductase family protein [Planctomycetota bacterium]
SFTSTWCGSCKKHRLDFHSIYNNYEKKGIQFYFIRVGEVAKDVQADLDAEMAPHKHYFDKDGKVSEKFKVDTTPTILIYNKNGQEIYRSDVYSEEEIMASLNTVLK